MRGDEERVIAAFCQWLRDRGWVPEREVGFADVVAARGEERLVAEAKGRTQAVGLDVDSCYGQLLRRISDEGDPCTRYALVVPEAGRAAALRVSPRVRALLGITVYVVSDSGQVDEIT